MDLDNPYAPPAVPIKAPPEARGTYLVDAGKGQRFVNFAVDSIAIGVLQVGASHVTSDATLAGVASLAIMPLYYVVLEE
jgi:hypothetical protein